MVDHTQARQAPSSRVPELREMSPLFQAREKIREAIGAIADTPSMDSGGGMGTMDLWPRIGGVEYHVRIKPSLNQPKG